MPTRRSLPVLAVLLLLALSSSAETLWRDAARDVYVSGALDRRAQVLVSNESPSRMAILSERLPRLVVLAPATGEVFVAPKRALSLEATRLAATLDGDLREAGRALSTSDGVHHAKLGRRDVLVKPHVSTAGPIAVDALLHDFPVWDAIRAAYEPDPESVRALAAIDEPTTFRIVLATWCGDSRAFVPRALKAIEMARNPELRVEIVGIGPDFHSPLGLIAGEHIINVPTIVVRRGLEEIGRMIESPATASVESDLAAIVAGTLPRHDGRWERGVLLASGTYVLRDGDGHAGTEEWRIFATPAGGRLVHSILRRGAHEREIWQRFDAAGKATFVEVTDRTPAETRRTRYRRGAETLTAHSRSNRGGITDQVLPMPEDCGFATGSIVAAAFACGGVGEGETRATTVYRIGTEPESVTGVVETVRISGGASRHVVVAEVERHARRRFDIFEDGIVESWVDAELGIPLWSTGPTGEATLVALRVE